MAKLRGGSSVGGKPVVTIDMLNKFVKDIQEAQSKNAMQKYEPEIVTASAGMDAYIKDKSKNGIWQCNNVTGISMYNYGTLFNMSHINTRFQLYAPHKETNSSGGDTSALYFRTGWDNDIKNWERVCTVSYANQELNKKFNKTGGDVTGDINCNSRVTGATLRVLKNNKFLYLDIDNVTGKIITSGDITAIEVDKPLTAVNNIYVKSNGANKHVWHEGNFNPGEYIKRECEELSLNYDLNNLKKVGFFKCNSPFNRPSNAPTGWYYIESLRDGNEYGLQKIYSYQGDLAFMRAQRNGVWQEWKSIGLSASFRKDISSDLWKAGTDIYELTVTHNLNTESISSVVVTDEEKMSTFTQFQVLSPSVIKVFCSNNVTGKVVINATT